MSGKELVKQAENKLKGGGFMSFLTGGPKYDEAAELYQQAANQFKLAKEWQEAATCLGQCAFCAQSSGSTSDQANFLMEAGNVLKKISTSQAVEQFEKAVAIYSSGGKFQQAGKLLMQIAELREQECIGDKGRKEVMDYYKRAADMFELDDHSKSNVTKCQLKFADFSAMDTENPENGRLEAIKIFEQEGEKALQNTLLSYGAKEHFLKAGILHLVGGDAVTANLANEKYRNLDPRFSSSREGELLQALVEAFEETDVDKFVDKLHDYDSVTKLDNWKMEFLLKVKDCMAPSSANDLDLT
jgi:alpha-soluble NSF attachment protein